MTERPLDAAERPDAPEFLEVEPGRAMHTGGFHDFLLRGWKAVSPGHELYVGITTRSHPETNTAIYEYANGVPAQHRRTRYEGTAVYKKGFLGRLGLNEADVLDGSCHRVPASAARDATGRIPVRLFGDEGIAVKAEDIFNLNEIEAIICWGVSREQTAAEYDAALRARGAAIPLYIQEENPAFAAEFDEMYGVAYRASSVATCRRRPWRGPPPLMSFATCVSSSWRCWTIRVAMSTCAAVDTTFTGRSIASGPRLRRWTTPERSSSHDGTCCRPRRCWPRKPSRGTSPGGATASAFPVRRMKRNLPLVAGANALY